MTHSALANQKAASSIVPILSLLLLDEEVVVAPERASAFTLVEDIEYTAYISVTPAFQLNQAQFSKTVTGADSITIDGLASDTNYHAKITATNAGGEVAWSNELPFKTLINNIS